MKGRRRRNVGLSRQTIGGSEDDGVQGATMDRRARGHLGGQEGAEKFLAKF